MITIYKTSNGKLKTISEVTDGCWINVIDPTPEEIEKLTALSVPNDFVTYPLDMDERSRIEREDDGSMLVVLRIPFFQGAKVDIPFTTIPIGITLTDRFIMTVCRHSTAIIEEFESGKIRGFSTSKRNRFLLRILLLSASQFLIYQRQINKSVELIEDRFEKTLQNKEILDMIKYQKSLVFFATALKANLLMVERLQRAHLFDAYPEDDDLLEDVITETQQANDMVSITSNILAHTMENFGNIVSNDLNDIMRLLTSMTIVLSIPTIITSFFGMNVALPFMDHPLAYVFIILITVAVAVATIIVFLKRRFF